MTQVVPQDPQTLNAGQTQTSAAPQSLMVPAMPGQGQEGSPAAGTSTLGPNDPAHQMAVLAGIMAGDRYDTGNPRPDMSLSGLSSMTMDSYDPANAMNGQLGLNEGGRVQGPPEPTGGGDKVLSIAKTYFGIPYQYGANGPTAYDCSSFVQHVYAQMGITLPRVTYDQVNTGQAVMDSSQLRPGDLLFFWGDGNRRNGHVGIFAGGNMMIDEPHTGSSVGYRTVNWGQVTAMRRVL